MEILVKKTTDLTSSEQGQLLCLFREVFCKERPLLHFRNQYLQNPIGYSYHALMLEEGNIVGSISYIPSYYVMQDKTYLFVLAVDAMVSSVHRSFSSFYNMVSSAYGYLKEQNVTAVYAFPNDTSFPIYAKSKLMTNIGNLNVYCLPLRVGGLKKPLRILNFLSIFSSFFYAYITSLFASNKVANYNIAKQASSYNQTRYQRLDGDYRIVSHRNVSFTYRVMNYEGVRTAFLLDVFEKSAKNFNTATRYILQKERQNMDILLYVGVLPFRRHGLIKLNERFSPKNFHFMGTLLERDNIDKTSFFNFPKWDVNLSDFDLL